ncbi:MAG: DUF2997 domain-containing protein [Planctomycetota bacterium]|nr:MAG: DUF2997 domain-containing protein [Planctomycetota bacterium]
MASEEIEIEIGVDGRVTVRTKGIKGEACKDYAQVVAQIIGRVESSTPTAELYETPAVVRRVVDIHHRH